MRTFVARGATGGMTGGREDGEGDGGQSVGRKGRGGKREEDKKGKEGEWDLMKVGMKKKVGRREGQK